LINFGEGSWTDLDDSNFNELLKLIMLKYAANIKTIIDKEFKYKK